MDEGGPAEGADIARRDEGGEEEEGEGEMREGGEVEAGMNVDPEGESEEEEEGAALKEPRDTIKVTVLSYQKTDSDYTYDIEVLTTPTALSQCVYNICCYGDPTGGGEQWEAPPTPPQVRRYQVAVSYVGQEGGPGGTHRELLSAAVVM